MIEEAKSTGKTLIERISNPFIGTFILCTLVFNWELIFILFNFDQGTSLKAKLTLIQKYLLKSQGTSFGIIHFILPAVYAIGLFIFYHIGKLFFAFITKEYNDRIEPKFLGMYHKVMVRRDLLVTTEINFDKLTTTYNSLLVDYREKMSEVSQGESQIRQLQNSLRQAQIDLEEFSSLKNTLYDYRKEDLNSKSYQLDMIFRGEYVCRWNFADKEKGKENFLINNGLYTISGHSYATIKNVRYYPERSLLYFEKHFSDTRPPGINHLIEIAPDHFIGKEINSDKSATIEYHSNNLRPENISLKL